MASFLDVLLSIGVVLLIAYLLNGNRWLVFVNICRTLPRDLLATFRYFKLNLLLWYWEKRGFTVARLFSRNAAAHPNKIAFIFEDKKWTYQQMENFSNNVGHYFRTRPFKRGETVALFMDGCPEYVGLWLGLSKAGLVTALINSNLRQDVLVHSIKAASSKAIIFGSEMKDAILAVKDQLPDLVYYQWTEDGKTLMDDSVDLKTSISSVEAYPIVDSEFSQSRPKDKLIYIYTSGTTGMPKAAVITNLRFTLIVSGLNIMIGLKSDDRLYDSLPLYHSAGGILGVGQALIFGITVVLRKKFSASNFWSDCVKYECTAAQYIGEICRFLLTVPPSLCDTTHKVRVMFGNGLRPKIWKAFVERFQVKQIGEFYGATEGNSNLINTDNTVGAVGFMPQFAAHLATSLYPVALIKVNEETGEPIRGEDGFCIRCKAGETGVMVGKINPKKVVNDFCGYTDKEASEKKVLYNVFKKGDKVFNSGDLLVFDELGYFYFKDRTGDTFRWRGENVSTSEVESVISNILHLKDAVVYGVEVPDVEGRAGMVAIHAPNHSLDLEQLAQRLKVSLPVYARPIFIRVLANLPMTGTYKLKKMDLQKEGYDITKIKDAVYVMDKTGSYERLTEQLYNDVLNGKLKL